MNNSVEKKPKNTPASSMRSLHEAAKASEGKGEESTWFQHLIGLLRQTRNAKEVADIVGSAKMILIHHEYAADDAESLINKGLALVFPHPQLRTAKRVRQLTDKTLKEKVSS